MIRHARPDEAGAVRDLVRAAYAHYVPRIGVEPGPMGDDYARRVADRQVYVAEHEGALVGVIVLEDLDGALLLDNVAVHPAHRGAGHGRMLLDFAERAARARGYGCIELYTHEMMTENQALYRRLGYRESGRRVDHGFPRVFMSKALG